MMEGKFIGGPAASEQGQAGGYRPKGDCRAAAYLNKALVLTAPALSNFGILARHNRFGGGVGVFLPHTARERRHNASVTRPSRQDRGKDWNPFKTKLNAWSLKARSEFPSMDTTNSLTMPFRLVR